MSDAKDLDQAIINAAQKPTSVSADGQSVTRLKPSEIAEAQKIIAANEAAQQIGNGGWPFGGFRIRFPGAGGF